MFDSLCQSQAFLFLSVTPDSSSWSVFQPDIIISASEGEQMHNGENTLNARFRVNPVRGLVHGPGVSCSRADLKTGFMMEKPVLHHKTYKICIFRHPVLSDHNIREIS